MKTDALNQLLGCYFHQDWHDEYPDETTALNAILGEVPKNYLDEGIIEIETILNARLDENQLSALLTDQIGCYFDPSSVNMNDTKWLQRVRDFLKMHIDS